jgi:regulatory protein
MLAVRLQRTGYEAAAIDSALERAEAAGYLNDRQYAESLVRRRRGTRGSAMIAQELRASGIDQRAAEPVLASLDPEVEFNNALTVGRKLVADRRLVGSEALLAYLAPKLARRGFANGVVYRVCRLLAGEWQAAGLFDESLEQN